MSIYNIFDDDLIDIVEKLKGTEASEAFGDCLSDVPDWDFAECVRVANETLAQFKVPLEILEVVERNADDMLVWKVQDLVANSD